MLASRGGFLEAHKAERTDECAMALPFILVGSASLWTRPQSGSAILACVHLALLRTRYGSDPTAFERVAKLARDQNVYLGCNCPTKHNPDVRRCHTVLALQFMAERFPDLQIELPHE